MADFVNGPNVDIIIGTDGEDFVRPDLNAEYPDGGFADSDLIQTGDGFDVISATPGTDSIDGGAQVDTLQFTTWVRLLDEDGDSYGSVYPTELTADMRAGTYTVKWIADNFGNPLLLATSTGTFANIEEIIATDGDDTIRGTDGGDRLIISGGANSYDGRGGNDEIELMVFSTSSITAPGLSYDVPAGTLTGLDGKVSTFRNIETFVTSFLNDTFVGDASDQTVFGSAGADSLTSGGGADELNYRGARAVRITQNTNTAEVFGFVLDQGEVWSTQTIRGFTNIELSNGNDNYLGSAEDETVFGSDGRDGIVGGGGKDTLTGGRGNDTIFGGAGADRLEGGAGRDTLRGNEGEDWLDFSLKFTRQAKVDVKLAEGQAIDPWGKTDLLFGIENVRATSKDDTIAGDEGRNRLEGRGGDDTITGGGGRDSLSGGGGHDALRGGSGNDTLDGEGGHDILIGGADDDLLYAGSGNDTLRGGSGNDELNGEDNDDILRGDDGNDELYGGEGSDDLEGGAQGDELYGGEGNDTLKGNGGIDFLIGDEGRDEVSGGRSADVVLGGSGRDTVWGGTGNDAMSGEGGNDTLFGGIGDDYLYPDAVFDEDLTSFTPSTGDDVVFGGLGDDTLANGFGRDTLDGGFGTDTLDAQSYVNVQNYAVFVDLAKGTHRIAGNTGVVSTLVSIENVTGTDLADNIAGDNGANVLKGGDMGDTLAGDGGSDELVGGFGSDTLFGGSGVDDLFGGSGQDRMLGEGGRDTLKGGQQNDRLFGGGNRDRLDGQEGNDVLSGGRGRDVFVGSKGEDVVRDFTPGQDRIDLDDADVTRAFAKFGDVRRASSNEGGDLVISLGGNNTITLQNILISQLDGDDFIF